MGEITAIVVAGGKATRMGWAPLKKPWLPVGPWDPLSRMGQGPCCIERALKNLYTLASYEQSIRAFVSVSVGEVVPPISGPFLLEFLHDTSAQAGPLLGPLRAKEQLPSNGKQDLGVILHNGDDLIHPESFALFKPHLGKFGSPVLLAARVVQRGYFGEITSANTVLEKPILSNSWVGAGLIYLPPDIVSYALRYEIENTSVLINRLYDLEGIVTRVVRSPHPWGTIGNPEQYRAACEDPIWHSTS